MDQKTGPRADEAERRLVARIAECALEHLRESPDDEPKPGDVFFLGGMNLKETADEFLERLAIIEDGRLQISGKEIFDHVLGHWDPESLPLADALRVFVQTDVSYGDVPGSRKSAPIPPRYELLFRDLIALGYARRTLRGFRWTDRMGRFMREEYLWDDRGLTTTEMWDRDAKVAWKTMSPTFKRHFFRMGPVDVLSLSKIVGHAWRMGDYRDEQDCGEWKQMPEGFDYSQFTAVGPGQLHIAMAMANRHWPHRVAMLYRQVLRSFKSE